jgi:hypothetical protein
MITDVPTTPEVGLRLVILGGGAVTVKFTPLLDIPATDTRTFPVVAAVGTGNTMLVALQEVGVAVVPLNVTVLAPCTDPKPVPETVTTAPTSPDVGLMLVMLGGRTVKFTTLLATPPTLTPTLPVDAVGTVAMMLVALQLAAVAATPLNDTVLVPWVVPKLVPLIVTDVPICPDVGLTLVIVGVGRTVKATALLARPPTVTTMLPVVAPAGTGTTMLEVLHEVGVAAVPLNVTVLVPWAAPKVEPIRVIKVPTAPEAGPMLLMFGATAKFTPLLATPPTMTTTLPVVAPDGTGTTMLVAAQLTGTDVVPLKLMKLDPCTEPKPVPVIVTEVPTGPDDGLTFVITGLGGITVKFTPLLGVPPTVTMTLPVVADGTTATIVVSLQLDTLACEPLKETVLVPCAAPKPVPEIVTNVETVPDVGFRLVILGLALRTVIVEEPIFVGSAIEVAVSVTVAGLGATGGAI